MNFRKNLFDLIKDAHLYEYVEINSSTEDIVKYKPSCFYTKIQWLILLVSLGIALFLRNGFSENFAGYIISGLSLFVGLFFTFILTLYDKFKSIDFAQYHIDISEDKNSIGIRLKNFFKKITVLSLYSVLIAIVCIMLLTLTLLFPIMRVEANIINFIPLIGACTYFYAIKFVLLIVYRAAVLYFLLDFLLIAIYIIAAFYDFIIGEYNKIKLS